MNIMTSEGIDIQCLPDCAICKMTGKSPEDMAECPICNFDNDGDVCVPDLCEEYDEV